MVSDCTIGCRHAESGKMNSGDVDSLNWNQGLVVEIAILKFVTCINA